MMWRDRKNPRFDPVIHLLWFLAVSHIRRGYVFARRNVLADIERTLTTQPNTQQRFFRIEEDQQMDEYTFNTYMKEILVSAVRSDASLWGTHTNRRTAVYLAVMGGGRGVPLKQGFRMKSDSTIQVCVTFVSFCFPWRGSFTHTQFHHSYIKKTPTHSF